MSYISLVNVFAVSCAAVKRCSSEHLCTCVILCSTFIPCAVPSLRCPVFFSFPVVHCRCSRCFSFPSKRRIIKRPRVLTFLNLPEDVLFHILKGLPAADILSVRAVSAAASPLPGTTAQLCLQEPGLHMEWASHVTVSLKKPKECLQGLDFCYPRDSFFSHRSS